MWWELGLPAAAMAASLGVTFFGPYYLLKVASPNGKPYFKRLIRQNEGNHFHRDARITGQPYILQGLEGIPDTDEPITNFEP